MLIAGEVEPRGAARTNAEQLLPRKVDRWVRVNGDGTLDMALLETDIGWQRLPGYFVEALDRESDIEAHVVDGVATACWYYRPLFIEIE